MKSVVFLFLVIISIGISAELDDDKDCDADYSETVSQQQSHSQSRKSIDVSSPSPRAPSPRTALQCRETIPKSTEGPPPYDSCDSGWTAFRRLKGVRCLKTLTGAVNQTTAVSLCEAQNAVLSGIENSNERDWIHEQFRPLVVNTADIRTVWLGAVRKPQCAVLTGFPDSCFPKETQMFYWTDTSVTGTDGFCPWWDTDPDNFEGKALQPCLQFAILRDTAPVGPYHATQGSLDDTVCSLAGPTLIGYVCSKPPLNMKRAII